MYQVVQSPGADGKNVLQLIPILNTKDNQVPVVSSPSITNTPVLNVQQPVRLSLPSAVSQSHVTLPYSLNAQLVQQIGSANYIITTQKNPADVSKTIRVDGKLSAHPNTAVILEKPPLNLPPNPQTGTPSFIIMNTKPGSAPMKTIPIFPPGHGLQIPNHAEVKSVPASSLPFSIQQRIVPPNTSNDTTKIPSVIYVSPVNTTKTPTTIPQAPLLSPVLVPAAQPGTTTPSKGPLKWVVQENTESIVPVRTNTDTASKIVTFMARAKTEEMNLPSPNVVQIKDNALVMCNNKIYFLSKSTGELRSAVQVKQETPEKNQFDTEKGKDLSKLIEVVLSKNNLPPPNPKPTLNSGSSPIVHPDATSPAQSKTCTPAQASKKEPEVIYIDDDDDEEDIPANIQKPQDICQSKETSSTKVYTPLALQISQSSDNQVKDKEVEIVKVIKNKEVELVKVIKDKEVEIVKVTKDKEVEIVKVTKDKEVEIVKVTKAPVFRAIDDQTLRAKFGLFKKEKIILNRLPLLRPESRTHSTSQNKDRLAYSENPERRKLPFSETFSISKRKKSEDAYDFSMTSDTAGNNCRSFSTTTAPLPAGTADATHTMSGEGTALTETNAAYRNVSAPHSAQDGAPEMYTEPSDSHSFYASQDIAGHFSEAPPPPRQRFHFESVYPDETTKDEKIQRLKEVLKEREQALEVLRRQKWS
ncbi:ligand-dependent nuclear receptor-interacting factor 1 isoform X2 [Lithobates pipiens]